mmetsp:Transcript_63/g.145  ORF Transcript_63/g.145 Transcript_63/m.145 type:complete len:1037 (+) Transcript_63:258-3368(+)
MSSEPVKGKGGRGGRWQQGKKYSNNRSSKPYPKNAPKKSGSPERRKKVLLLHGNRQTGEVLLGRMDKLRKALLRELELDVVAPDAPHLFNEADSDYLDCNDYDSTQWQRTWWHREDNTYRGMEESISMLDLIWNKNQQQDFVAILGFSQGSRLAHFISLLHSITNGMAFPGLKCVIHFSGYGDRSMPDNLPRLLKDRWSGSISTSILSKLNQPCYNFDNVQVNIPSLHVMGESDALIPLKSSEALLNWYNNPSVHVFPGNHYVPVKKIDIDIYVNFLKTIAATPNTTMSGVNGGENCCKDLGKAVVEANTLQNNNAITAQPDEEHAQTQIDEVTALAQIFPTEFRLLSESIPKDSGDYDPDDYCEENRLYEYPITYSIILQPQDGLEREEQLWPPKTISLCIKYPLEYPDESPVISLMHDMNYLEFSLQASEALIDDVRKAVEEEAGMPCVLSMVYAARSFFEEGGLSLCAKIPPSTEKSEANVNDEYLETKEQLSRSSLLPSDATRIKECNAQGLQVAYAMLGRARSDDDWNADASDETVLGGKGGTWHYTVGLVGKPSAGKSTFFNAATAFARQRGEGGGEMRCEVENGNEGCGIILGGASMAPHPFTTIDPNIGYCLVPAPSGACPEDEEGGRATLIGSGLDLGSSHGRDSKGRRLIPVCLKDVAGLVPGAYQGRGRGNKFLDDLTDADVLVHIVDASGSSDSEGNRLTGDGSHDDLNHPLNDLEWVRNELVEWVYFNLSSKWDSVVRRGQEKLIGMFSGYKQRQSFTHDVFVAVERFIRENEGRDCVFDQLETWDEGDLHRLVSAFLGARFPMALALNKSDIPTATQHVKDIESKLPIHGAHVGVNLSAYDEMTFVRHHLALSFKDPLSSHAKASTGTMSSRVWDCLQSAVSLREPTLVFPVNDMKTYESLPGMTNYATRDSSLPNHGFISCITAAGGCAPSQWNSQRRAYVSNTNESAALRDVLLMKPGSTVESVFRALKGIRCLEGEFVRAEAASGIGEKPKPVPKSEVIGRHNRILRIMTTKRKEWQKK